jgi:hypothetical protein
MARHIEGLLLLQTEWVSKTIKPARDECIRSFSYNRSKLRGIKPARD